MTRRHQIQPGDSVTRLAEQNGLFVDSIVNHPDNQALREKRANMDALLPGDVIVIPNKKPRAVRAATGQKHRFKRKGVPAVFRIQLFDQSEARSNQHYSLSIDGRTYEGTTDGDGLLEQAVPTNAERGELVIGPDDFRVSLVFGGMDPIEEVSGIQKRLRNLGFASGADATQMNDGIRRALKQFQAKFGLEPTGECDAATRSKLSEAHDDVGSIPESADPKERPDAGGAQ